MMRIITGSARGTKLQTLQGEATRPTSERAKEAIFSMLQFGLSERRVLDLFGGSGQMGLEALSRGAAAAVFVDASPEATKIIAENAARTRLATRAEICRTDALSFLATYRGAPFHLVFLDPPYAAGLVPKCLAKLLERRLLTPGATLVCEVGEGTDIFGGDAALAARFTLLKENRYGLAKVFIITPLTEEAP